MKKYVILSMLMIFQHLLIGQDRHSLFPKQSLVVSEVVYDTTKYEELYFEELDLSSNEETCFLLSKVNLYSLLFVPSIEKSNLKFYRNSISRLALNYKENIYIIEKDSLNNKGCIDEEDLDTLFDFSKLDKVWKDPFYFPSAKIKLTRKYYNAYLKDSIYIFSFEITNWDYIPTDRYFITDIAVSKEFGIVYICNGYPWEKNFQESSEVYSITYYQPRKYFP